MLTMDLTQEQLSAARKIRLIAFDVDGVLTDGRITYTASGEEIKSFNVRDGHAIKLAKRAGLATGIITGRTSSMVEFRARELGMDYLYQGAKDKVQAMDALLEESGLTSEQVAYLGDDIVDIPVIRRAGLGCAVADAPREVKAWTDIVLESAGGDGAARELVVLILMAQDLWEGVLERYIGSDAD